MVTIKFIGDPKDGFSGPKIIDWHGLECPKGKAVRCSDPWTIRRAEGSNHFKVKGNGPDGK